MAEENKEPEKAKERSQFDGTMRRLPDGTWVPRRGRAAKFTDASIIAALHKTRGLVYLASQVLGCTPLTIFNRANKRPEVRSVIEDERNRVVDFGELKLIEAVQRGDAWAVCFLLKTQGRRRGYSERFEVEDIRREMESIRLELASATGRSPGTPPTRFTQDRIGYPELSS